MLPEAGIATPERGQLIARQRRRRCSVPAHMPKALGGIAADPFLVLPPAHSTSQGGQLTVHGAGVCEGGAIGHRSAEPWPGGGIVEQRQRDDGGDRAAAELAYGRPLAHKRPAPASQ